MKKEANGLFVLLYGWNAKGRIQRTKTHKTCKNENCSDYQEYNGCSASDTAHEIQNCNYDSRKYPQSFVNGTHIFFHLLWLLIIKTKFSVFQLILCNLCYIKEIIRMIKILKQVDGNHLFLKRNLQQCDFISTQFHQSCIFHLFE